MEGVAGRQRIAGRLASTLGALAVDFGNRDLGLLGIARVGISFASWCLAIALGVYGFEVGGAVAVGVVALVRLLPGALASPFAGLLGDRFPRRDVLIGSGLAITVVLAADERRGRRWTATPGSSPSSPGSSPPRSAATCPAEAALLPALARSPQELSAANVTHSAMDNVGFLAAALTTGVLLALRRPGDRLRSRRRRRPDHHRRADPDRARRAARLRRPTARSPALCAQSALGFRTLLGDPACACSARCWWSSSSSRASPTSWS